MMPCCLNSSCQEATVPPRLRMKLSLSFRVSAVSTGAYTPSGKDKIPGSPDMLICSAWAGKSDSMHTRASIQLINLRKWIPPLMS